MSEIEAPNGMTLAHDEYEITDSKDSTWQEWSSGTKYFVDQARGDILAIDYDGFDNARNQSSNWERETGRRTLSLEEVPLSIRPKIEALLST